MGGQENVGFRATGTFSTGRTFTLNQANNAIEVTGGNTFVLRRAMKASGFDDLITRMLDGDEIVYGGFGSDGGPDLVTAGIWRPVRLERWHTARLAAVRPVVTVEEDGTDPGRGDPLDAADERVGRV